MTKSTGHKIAACIACVAWASGGSLVWAQSGGTFTQTGSMSAQRSYGMSATVLTDGKVLIAGGYTEGLPIWGSAPTNAAEIYDPATGKFSPAGPMNSARALHAATLLLDGRVLIAGGYAEAQGPYLTSAELYDPSTRTFTIAGNLTAPSVASLRPEGGPVIYPPPPPSGDFGQQIELMNGKYLFAGGADDPGPDTYAAVWDYATGTFDAGVGQMRDARADQAMALLPDGKVLVTGGNTWASVPPPSELPFVGPTPPASANAMYEICCLSSAELFDPVTEQFTVTGSMVAGRSLPTATVLSSGDVLIVGGTVLSQDDGVFTQGIPAGTTAELYHPATLIPPPAAFFTGAVSLESSVYYLQLPNSTVFGYYTFVSSTIFYHCDMGYEALVPGSASDVYLYDFSSGHWWYTSPGAFPFLYDFTLETWIYYFPNTTSPGHYTTGPRYFSNLTTGQIFMM